MNLQLLSFLMLLVCLGPITFMALMPQEKFEKAGPRAMWPAIVMIAAGSYMAGCIA